MVAVFLFLICIICKNRIYKFVVKDIPTVIEYYNNINYFSIEIQSQKHTQYTIIPKKSITFVIKLEILFH